MASPVPIRQPTRVLQPPARSGAQASVEPPSAIGSNATAMYLQRRAGNQQTRAAFATPRAGDTRAALKLERLPNDAQAPIRPGWLQIRIYFAFRQMTKGFQVEAWDILATEPDDGLTRDERRTMDAVIGRAVFESEAKYAHLFAGTLRAQALRVDLRCPFADLREGRSRDLLVFHIGDQLRAAVTGSRNVEAAQESEQRERLRLPPPPGRTVEQELTREKAVLHDEMRDMREEMQAGLKEQQQAQTAMAEFAALVAVSPPPDLRGWQAPETYIRSAELALDADDPRGANMFMDVARGSLKDQQAWWARYKRDSEFGDEVIGPVFWQAFSLLSLGIVDEELFDKSAQQAKKGIGPQLEFIVMHIVDRVGNLVTFGGYEAWKKGVEQRIERAPDDPLWEVMLAAGPDAVQGIIDTMLPIAEVKAMAGVPTKDESGKEIHPDFWAKVSAFFSALMKVAMLAEMAGSKMKGKGKGKSVGEQRGKVEKPTKESSGGTHQEIAQQQTERAASEKSGKAGEPARSPEREGRGKVGKTALSTLVPDEFPNVQLINIPLQQFHSLLAELESSTPKGREIAQRIRSGELHVTFDAEGITPKARGLALSKEIHVKWGASIQETASTTIHEGVHQADPQLKNGPRSQVEATARVYEYEYNASRGLKPQDAAENIYRAVLKDAQMKGGDPAAALERARNAAIDMMRADPERYAIEKTPEGKSKGPARSPTPEAEPSAKPEVELKPPTTERQVAVRFRADPKTKGHFIPGPELPAGQDPFAVDRSAYLKSASKEYKAAAANPEFVVLPEGQARAMGFVEKGKPFKSAAENEAFQARTEEPDPVAPVFTPYQRGGVQIESSKADPGSHPIAGRTSPKRTPAESEGAWIRTVAPSLEENESYKFQLVKKGELGLKRAGNASERGADHITADMSSDPPKIYLNDATTPDQIKNKKPSHKDWYQQFKDDFRPNASGVRDFGFGPEINAKLNAAVDAGEVYTRTLRPSEPAAGTLAKHKVIDLTGEPMHEYVPDKAVKVGRRKPTKS